MNYISRHFFLFPFQWKIKNKDKSDLLTEIKSLISLDNWSEFKFEFKIFENNNTYNDYTYFFESVRDVLNLDKNKNEIVCLQYQSNIVSEESLFIINSSKGDKYELKIKDIILNIYEEVGIFVFHLENLKYDKLEDILKINELGRRIYPPFLGADENFINAPKDNFMLADSFQILNLRNSVEIFENFEYYNSFQNIDKGYFNLPNHIQYFLGDNFGGIEKNKIVEITPVLDDRMFVISHYKNKNLLDTLRIYDEKNNKYTYENSEDWYRYLFIDSLYASCSSKVMIKKLLSEHTYDRWIDAGSLYGVSRYSFVLLTDGSDFADSIVDKHIQTVYFEVVMLSLLQRVYVVLYGNKIAKIAHKIKNSHYTISQYRKDISAKYLDYLKYDNRIYFREVTAQEQGIELYDILQEKMKTKAEVDDLKSEIQELNNFVETSEQSSLNNVANLFLPLSFITGFLGMNMINDDFIKSHQAIFNLLLNLLLFASVYVIFVQYKKWFYYLKNKIWK